MSVAVDEAIAFIRKHEPPEGYFVAFSGGKDSIVTLELTRMAGVKHQAYYSATGIDPPEMVQFIREHYPEVKWSRPKPSSFKAMFTEAPPLRMQRWCCDVLKKDPSATIPLAIRLSGLRREESSKRASRPRIDPFIERGQVLHKPIFHWKEWLVWEFIESHGLPYPSLYDEGFDRIGCVVCPFICTKNQRQVDRNKARWPGIYRAFEHAVTRWFNAKRLGHDKNFANAKEYIEAWYRGFE
jgi:phosphoadenosine phosphosulfate reductase